MRCGIGGPTAQQSNCPHCHLSVSTELRNVLVFLLRDVLVFLLRNVLVFLLRNVLVFLLRNVLVFFRDVAKEIAFSGGLVAAHATVELPLLYNRLTLGIWCSRLCAVCFIILTCRGEGLVMLTLRGVSNADIGRG